MRCGSRLGAVRAGCVARELRAHMWRQQHVGGQAALVRGSAVQPLRSWIGRKCEAGGRRVCRRLRPGAYEESAREAAVLRGKLHAEAVLVPRLDHPAAQVHQPAGRGTGQGGGHAPPRVQLQSPVLPRKRAELLPRRLGPAPAAGPATWPPASTLTRQPHGWGCALWAPPPSSRTAPPGCTPGTGRSQPADRRSQVWKGGLDQKVGRLLWLPLTNAFGRHSQT